MINLAAGRSDRVMQQPDTTIRFWDIETGECLKTLLGHTNWIWSIFLSPDAQVLASGSEDKTIKIWDIETCQCLKTLEGHIEAIITVATKLAPLQNYVIKAHPSAEFKD